MATATGVQQMLSTPGADKHQRTTKLRWTLSHICASYHFAALLAPTYSCATAIYTPSSIRDGIELFSVLQNLPGVH